MSIKVIFDTNCVLAKSFEFSPTPSDDSVDSPFVFGEDEMPLEFPLGNITLTAPDLLTDYGIDFYGWYTPTGTWVYNRTITFNLNYHPYGGTQPWSLFYAKYTYTIPTNDLFVFQTNNSNLYIDKTNKYGSRIATYTNNNQIRAFIHADSKVVLNVDYSDWYSLGVGYWFYLPSLFDPTYAIETSLRFPSFVVCHKRMAGDTYDCSYLAYHIHKYLYIDYYTPPFVPSFRNKLFSVKSRDLLPTTISDDYAFWRYKTTIPAGGEIMNATNAFIFYSENKGMVFGVISYFGTVKFYSSSDGFNFTELSTITTGVDDRNQISAISIQGILYVYITKTVLTVTTVYQYSSIDGGQTWAEKAIT